MLRKELDETNEIGINDTIAVDKSIFDSGDYPMNRGVNKVVG